MTEKCITESYKYLEEIYKEKINCVTDGVKDPEYVKETRKIYAIEKAIEKFNVCLCGKYYSDRYISMTSECTARQILTDLWEECDERTMYENGVELLLVEIDTLKAFLDYLIAKGVADE